MCVNIFTTNVITPLVQSLCTIEVFLNMELVCLDSGHVMW